MQHRVYLSVLTFVFLASLSAPAKLFKNAYVQFDLPNFWECKLEGTEWVCSSKKKGDDKEAIVILTAKEAGPQDNFNQYMTHLKQVRSQPLPNGKPTPSKIKQPPRQRKINGHPWVDSLHLGSEIPGYYTRYLATIKDKLAILVTASAHQKYYTKYSSDFFKLAESLRVVASKNLFAPPPSLTMRPPIGAPPTAQLPPLPTEGDIAPLPGSGTGAKSDSNTPLALLGFLLLLGGLYYWRKSRG